MRRETMTSEERIAAALRLEKPDRVPIVPHTPPEPIAGLGGITVGEYLRNPEAAVDAFLKVVDDCGGYDAYTGGPMDILSWQTGEVYPMRVRVPGVDLPDEYVVQVIEEPILKVDDYDIIAQIGWNAFFESDFRWRLTSEPLEDVRKSQMAVRPAATRLVTELAKRDMRPWKWSPSPWHPFFTLSLARSMQGFTEDLFYHPDLVERAIKRMTDDLTPVMIEGSKRAGLQRTFFIEERASAYYYRLPIFERFWMPYTQQIVDAMWAEGIATIFHLDTCWDKNLPYFRQLPKKSFIVSLDGMTDIFRAKEILRGHGAITGDVPAAMLSLSRPEDVEAYVKHLIDEVGGDGGYILGVACCVPVDTRPENWQAFIRTGKTYELSKTRGA